MTQTLGSFLAELENECPNARLNDGATTWSAAVLRDEEDPDELDREVVYDPYGGGRGAIHFLGPDGYMITPAAYLVDGLEEG